MRDVRVFPDIRILWDRRAAGFSFNRYPGDGDCGGTVFQPVSQRPVTGKIPVPEAGRHRFPHPDHEYLLNGRPDGSHAWSGILVES
jgi:hypothetical protein